MSLLQDRGPDETSILEFNNFLIGFNRLNINNIDNGSQPFISRSKRYLICFNGEIVNYKDLIDYLLKKKIKLSQKSEAEVILELYFLYKEKCLNYLKGMFSFVIIDKFTETIFAATDRFGIKPLYYGYTDNKKCFYLTSNFSPLVKTKLIPKIVNNNTIRDFICFGQIYDSSTLIKNVCDLKNGNFIEFTKNKLLIKKYWIPQFLKNKEKNHKILFEEIVNKLKSTIKYWRTSEEKLSLCLSDGVDSQILLSLLLEDNKDLETFSIALNPKQVISKQTLHNNFIKFNLGETLKLFRNFSKKNYILLSNPSDLTLFQLYNSISEKGFKVAFTGDGADEIFGGYYKYQKILQESKKNKNFDFKKNYFSIYKNTLKQFNLFTKSKIKNNNVKFNEKINKLSLEDKCLFTDQMFWVPTVQKRHDVIGMNFGLEIRPFFLDHDLASLINSLPTEMKFNLKKRKITAYKILNKLSNFKPSNIKYGTPNFTDQIISNKKEISQFFENFRYGILGEYFDFECFKKNIEMNMKSNNNNNINIVFWRLFYLNELLK